MLTRVQDTSIASFHVKRDSGRTSDQRAYIVDFIAYIGGDWSIGELADRFSHMPMALALGLDQKSTVSARINECIHSGELKATEYRKDRVSGVRVRPVTIGNEEQIQRGLF